MNIIQKIKKEYNKKKELKAEKKLREYTKKYVKTQIKNREYVERLIEEETEAWKINKSKESLIKAKASIAILIGCCLLLVSFCIEIYFSTNKLEEVEKSILSAVLNVINIVTSMVVGIGVSTIVLDFFSYVQYTRDRLKEIIVDKEFIRKLSDEEKKNIIVKAEESLYFKDGRLLPNSLYADVKKKITPLLDSCYFSEFDMTISCDVDEKNSKIRKEILKKMTIISNDDDAEFSIPFTVSLRQLDCEEKEEAYEIIDCIFRGEDITADFKAAQKTKAIEEKERVSNSDDTTFSANYAFKLKKGENTLEIRSKTVVPIDDNIYSHYFTLPCMKYTATFNMNTENYSVYGYGFALEDEKISKEKKMNVSYSRIGKSLVICINEWALPGEGSMFIINPNVTIKENENNG